MSAKPPAKKYARSDLADARRILDKTPELIPGTGPTTPAAILAQRDFNRAMPPRSKVRT